jgi:hypothetical protein
MENHVIKPYDPGACSASFLMCKRMLVDPLNIATPCLAITDDGWSLKKGVCAAEYHNPS